MTTSRLLEADMGQAVSEVIGSGAVVQSLEILTERVTVP
jgi:hypothetical protein